MHFEYLNIPNGNFLYKNNILPRNIKDIINRLEFKDNFQYLSLFFVTLFSYISFLIFIKSCFEKYIIDKYPRKIFITQQNSKNIHFLSILWISSQASNGSSNGCFHEGKKGWNDRGMERSGATAELKWTINA